MKKYWYIYVVVLLLSTVLLTGCTRKTNDIVEQDQDDTQEVVEDLPQDDTESSSSFDTSEYTKEETTLGQASEYEYTIREIRAEEKTGYHQFEFTLSSRDGDAPTPLFTVTPILTKGVFRVSLTNIIDDNTSVTHSSGISVNKEGITGLTRIVTDSNTTRAYDIGVLGLNMYMVEVENDELGIWTFVVKVSYDTKYTPPSIDFGSTEFSPENQEIEGVTITQGAKITDYSYLYSSGIVKFTLEVSSGASNPIPSVTAAYDEEGILILTFPSLEQDKVSTWGSTIDLPSGLTVSISRAGEKSVYSFSGISNKKPFRLSASQSPNVVIVEIDV